MAHAEAGHLTGTADDIRGFMMNTIGYHYVRSGYALWLPGDSRGYWSEAWDAQIGYIEPHTLHVGDPVRHRMAEERRAHPPVRWSADVQRAIESAVRRCADQSHWDVAAFGIEPTHLHVALTYTARNIDGVAKWLGQQMTKAVHQQTTHTGPVFCKNHWLQFIYEQGHWDQLLPYIGRHHKAADVIGDPPDALDDVIRTIDALWPDDRG